MMAMDVGVDSDEDAKDSIAAIFEWFDSENKGYITTGQLRWLFLDITIKVRIKSWALIV